MDPRVQPGAAQLPRFMVLGGGPVHVLGAMDPSQDNAGFPADPENLPWKDATAACPQVFCV